MSTIARLTPFIPHTLIESGQMNPEFNQIVDLLSGGSTDKSALLKYTHATDPVLRVDQLGAGKILSLLQNGVEKARIDNDGSAVLAGLSAILSHASNPVVNVNQTGAGLIQRWQKSGVDIATLSALGKLLLPAGIGATPSTDTISNLGTYFVDPVARNTPGNTTETDFSTKTTSANVLANDGDFLIALTSALTAANGNTKRLRMYFGGNVIGDTGAIALNNGVIILASFFLRSSSSSIIGAYFFLSNSFLVTGFASAGSINLGSYNFATTNILKTTGQNGSASAADLSQRTFIVIKGSV
jgi:hypothetical protein